MGIRISWLLKIVFPALAMAAGCSCPSGNASVDFEDSIADSVAYVKDTVEKKPERRVLSFSTVSEALGHMRESGHWERYSNGIIPTMAYENIGYAVKLLNNEYDRFIIVDKATMKVILYNKYGEVLKKYGMACAKNYGTKHRKADSRTPEGFFTAEGIYDSTDWLFTDDNGVTSKKKGQFGPRFVRLRCPNTSQIGIHGTVAPWSIGHRVSHGCIRLTNENILDLVQYVQVGMPVIVSPGPRDMAVNESEGYYISSVTTIPGRKRAEPHRKVLPLDDEDTQKDTVDHSSENCVPAESAPCQKEAEENLGSGEVEKEKSGI